MCSGLTTRSADAHSNAPDIPLRAWTQSTPLPPLFQYLLGNHQCSMRTTAFHYEHAFLLVLQAWTRLKEILEDYRLKLSGTLDNEFKNSFACDSLQDNERLLRGTCCEPVRKIFEGTKLQSEVEYCKGVLEYRTQYTERFFKLAMHKRDQYMEELDK